MSASFRDVLALVRDWVSTQDQQFDAWAARWALADKVDGAYTRHGNLDASYCGQIMRALNMLTSEGALVKRSGRSRDPLFYTPEAYARYERDAERAAAAYQAEKDRFQAAYDRLVALGFKGHSAHLTVTFGAADMEQLADRLSSAPRGPGETSGP